MPRRYLIGYLIRRYIGLLVVVVIVFTVTALSGVASDVCLLCHWMQLWLMQTWLMT